MDIDFGIIAAMEPEVKILIEMLENKTKQTIAGLTYYHGTFKGRQVCLLQCGIGKVNAAVGTAIMLEKWAPKFMINTGVAGGLQVSTKIGDIILSQKVAHHDVDTTVFGYEMGQVPQLPLYYEADKYLLEKGLSCQKQCANIKIEQGLIISGDQFVSSSAQRSTLLNHFPMAKAVEMEAAAIAQTSWLLKTPFLIVRSISDNIFHEENHLSYQEFLPIAAKNSADLVCALIEQS